MIFDLYLYYIEVRTEGKVVNKYTVIKWVKSLRHQNVILKNRISVNVKQSKYQNVNANVLSQFH